MSYALCHVCILLILQPRRQRSELERSPRKRKVGCSNSNRDRPKSLKQVVTTPLTNARHKVLLLRVLGDNHYKRISQYMWHAKEPSLLYGHKCRALVKICSPSSAMVTSPKMSERFSSETKTYKEINKQIYLGVGGGGCLLLSGISSHMKIFPSYRNVTIKAEGLQILIYTRHLWPFSREGSEGSFACHT